ASGKPGWEAGSHFGMSVLHRVQRSDNIRMACSKISICSGDVQRTSGKQVEDHTDIPPFNQPCDDSRTVAKHQLVWLDGQFDGAVKAEVVFAAGTLDASVQTPVQYVQPGRRTAGVVGGN